MDEILALLAKLDKKVDKLTNLTTKIAKTLHLVPVTEKEEREIQLLQRKNLGVAAKVSAELDDMLPKSENPTPSSLFDIYGNSDVDVFGDVLGDDFLGGATGESV